MAQFKIEQLNLERRWKLEQLKPTINLNYNLLSARAGTGEEWFNYSQNNYKWGVEFAYPIFLRKARGGLLATNLKLQEAEISIKFKQQQLLAKAIALNQEVIVSQQQVGRYTQVVDDYQLLVAAEQRLFNVGESSLFLVNSREQSFISAQVKLIEMQVKSQKAQAASNNALGQVD